MHDISTRGLSAYLLASETMPVGMLLNQFADEDDSIDITEASIGGARLDLNGKVISWTSANVVTVRISLIPEGVDDSLLGVIYNANRVSSITKSAADIINLVVRYPNGNVRTFTNGRMISGPGGPTAKAEGRLATNTYTIAFGDQYTLSVASALNTALKLLAGPARKLLGI